MKIPASYFHSGKNSQEYINAAVSKIKDAITPDESATNATRLTNETRTQP